MASKTVGSIKAVASKTKLAPQKSAQPKDGETPEKDAPETPDAPLPLLDLSDAAVKKMIKQAKKRGYVTYEQLNSVMPSEEVTSEQIEDVLSMMSEMGINVVETEEAEADEEEGAREEPEEEEAEGGDLVEVTPKPPAKSEAKEPAERTDDPVRMYLREMGSVELLSREGEIAIAKRIEAGREAMIAGLCESPLTFQAVIIWRDELNEGKVFLRDIIDLEATYAGPDAKNGRRPARPAIRQRCRRRIAGVPGFAPQPPQAVAPPSAPPAATPFKPPGGNGADGATAKKPRSKPPSAKPIWTRTISKTRCRLPPSRPSSSPRCWRPSTTSPTPSSGCAGCRSSTSKASCKNETLSPAQERKSKKLKEDIITEVKSLRLNQARIDSLVEQLYDINKRLVGHEGRLMRLAESHGVIREDFLKNYQGSELDPRWLNRVSKLSAKGWKNFVARDKDRIKELRAQIHTLAVRDRPRDRRVPQDRAHGAEGRARSAPGEEGDGGGEPAARHLHRQEIHQPRPAIPGSDPGRQYRPDEGGR